MVVKVYISGISGNKEVKKRQQRVLMILDSRNFKYELIDIAEPDNEADKDFMHNNSTSMGATIGDSNPRCPLPPQIFNDTTYCGDYDQFDMSNEIDELEKFLKLAPDESTPSVTSSAEIQFKTNGNNSEGASKIEEETNEAEALENSNEAEAVQVEKGSAEVNGSGTTQEEADGGVVEDNDEAENDEGADDA